MNGSFSKFTYLISHHQIARSHFHHIMYTYFRFGHTVAAFPNPLSQFQFNSSTLAFPEIRWSFNWRKCYVFLFMQICLLLIMILLSLFLSSLSAPFDKDIDHVHAALAAFLLCGQLIIKTFAPLSLLLRSNCQESCAHVLLSWDLSMASVSLLYALQRTIFHKDYLSKGKVCFWVSGVLVASCVVYYTVPFTQGNVSLSFLWKVPEMI